MKQKKNKRKGEKRQRRRETYIYGDMRLEISEHNGELKAEWSRT